MHNHGTCSSVWCRHGHIRHCPGPQLVKTTSIIRTEAGVLLEGRIAEPGGVARHDDYVVIRNGPGSARYSIRGKVSPGQSIQLGSFLVARLPLSE